MACLSTRAAAVILMLAAGHAPLVLAPAQAQSESAIKAYASAPADRLLVTKGGVDLRSGRYAYSETDLAIGGKDGLNLTRLPRGGIWGHIEPFGNFTHNFDIMIAEKRVHIHGGQFFHGSGTDYRMIVRFDARSDTFDAKSTAPYFSQVSKAATARLTYTGDISGGSAIYSFQSADGTVAIFRPIGSGDCSSKLRCAFVSEIRSPDGTVLTFEYEASLKPNRLRSVTSSRGYALLLEYGGGGGGSHHVSKACVLNLASRAKPANNICPTDALATTSYTYTSTGIETVLASSTDPTQLVSRYVHGAVAAYKTIGFVKPGAQAPWLTNHYSLTADHDEEGRKEIVVRQEYADGQAYDVFTDNGGGETEGTITSGGGGEIIDAAGRRITVKYGFPKLHYTLRANYNPNVPREYPQDGSTAVYQVTEGPISVTDELGRTTTYEYCDPYIREFLGENEPDNCVVGALQHYTDPEGIRTYVVYDGWRNLSGVRRVPKPGSTLSETLWRATYDCVDKPKSCAKPTSTTDARNFTTTYQYAVEHGGLLKETSPAINGVTAQKRYTYQPRHAWIVSGSGYAKVSTPVWLLTQMSFCRTGNPASSGVGCALAGDEVVTTYDYGPDSGPNNLLLRAEVVTADGRSLRTCYRYDALGRKIAETKPTENLAVCP